MSFARRGGIAFVLGLMATAALRVTSGLNDAALWANLLALPMVFVLGWQVLTRYGNAAIADPSSSSIAFGHDLTNLEQARSDLMSKLLRSYRAAMNGRLRGRIPLTLRWSLADPLLQGTAIVDPGVLIANQASENRILKVLENCHLGRLVILGESGSGKSFLSLQLALDSLSGVHDSAYIPYIFSPSDWDPFRQPLEKFLQASLLSDFPDLQGNFAENVWRKLVADNGVMIIVDGFNQIPPSARAEALKQFNSWAGRERPLILTSTAEVYQDVLTGGGEALSESTAVTLDRVDPLDALDFLHTGAARANIRNLWPDGRVSLAEPALISALTRLETPFLVAMAWEASKLDKLSPDSLISLSQAGEDILDKTLTDRFVDSSVELAARRLSVPSHRIRIWMVELVAHLQRGNVEQFGWWGVGSFSGRPSMAWALGFTTFGACELLAAICTFGHGVLVGAAMSLAVSTFVGIFVGIGSAVGYRTHPSRISWRLPTRQELITGLVGGPLIGMAAGVLIVAALAVAGAKARWPIILVGPTIGLGVGLVAALGSAFDTALAEDEVLSPRAVYIGARRGALSYSLATSLASSTVFGLGFWLFSPFFPIELLGGSRLELALRAAALGFVSMLLVTLGLTRWAQFEFLHSCRALQGRMPWRYWSFMAVLVDSGILRTIGSRHELAHSLLTPSLTSRELERARSSRPLFRR